MTEHTLRRIRSFLTMQPVSFQVRYEGGTEEGMREWLGDDLRILEQGEGDLGRRMDLAFSGSFREGMGRVVIIGADCPGIRPFHLMGAFRSLEHKDAVIGPASDGGYYLVGLRQPASELFQGIPWGTEEVLERTLEIARARGIGVELLGRLDDVDRPLDIPVWEREARAANLPAEAPSISIVIPVVDEGDEIRSAIAATRGDPSVVERIVVDGGSTDGSVEKARSCGARVVRSAPWRSKQMNAGAKAAAGDVLLFLHADTRLPPGFERHIREILGRPDTVAGAFRLAIDGSFPGLRVIEWLANFRSIRMGMPYGDQAIFIHADRFHRAGGFPEIPVMEDFEFMRRRRREGRIGIAPASAVTSVRRYRKYGFWRTTWVNQLMIIAYLLGFSPGRLSRWYRSGLRRKSHGPA
jgi:rSAM/selenodomain-associated transferase 2/rSAM/selenodomain-associated transferase 1